MRGLTDTFQLSWGLCNSPEHRHWVAAIVSRIVTTIRAKGDVNQERRTSVAEEGLDCRASAQIAA
jgi:hypothetical protein